MEGMITHFVVRSGDDDSLRGSRVSPDGAEAVGKKDASAPEEFRKKEHAEVKPHIAKKGSEAEGIVERERECLCVEQRPAELGDAKELSLCCPKIGSADVSFEQCQELSDAEYEQRPAAACAAGTCPDSDRSADAGKEDRDRVRENFSKHTVLFGGQPDATSVQQLDVPEEERLTRKNSHPHRSVKGKVERLLE
ncbi:hypothetical protein MRX96_001124 [Rhipicephalus microplus]